MMLFPPKCTASCSIFILLKEKKSKFFILIFQHHGNVFDILLVFVSFLQTYYDIFFFHIFAFHFIVLEIRFCIYVLLALLIFPYHFYNNLLLYLVSDLYFYNKFLQKTHSFFTYDKNNYKTPFLSFKLELFIMLTASSLLIQQK